MKILFSLLILFYISGCQNSETKENPKTVVTVQEPSIPGVAPKKVNGIFKGELPCKDCSGIQVMLTLKDSSFSEIKNYKNAKDKKHSMAADLGICKQDSGLVKLFNKSILIGTYRIISSDSLLLIESASVLKPTTRQDYFLIKNKPF